MSEMFSGKHDESEPCDGCGKVPSVHMGHGSYSCKTCFEEAFCEKCKYMKSADGSHECPSPEEHARRKAEFEFFARDASGEEPLLKACMRLRGEIATLTADRDRLREECARARTALANVSGALCDSGVVVPAEEWRYGEAVREIVAQRDEANAEEARLGAVIGQKCCEVANLRAQFAALSRCARVLVGTDRDAFMNRPIAQLEAAADELRALLSALDSAGGEGEKP